MKALAIDTSNYQISLCAFKEEKSFFLEAEGFSSAAKLASFAQLTLKGAGLKIGDLEAVAVGIGPGSFTGLRISASFAKGLCLGLKIPLVAAPSFLALAYEYKDGFDYVVPVVDARRGNVYAALYKTCGMVRPLIKESLSTLSEFLKKLKSKRLENKRLLFAGESLKFKDEIESYLTSSSISFIACRPKALFLRPAVEKALKNKKFTPLDKFEPLYLYKQDVQARKS